MYVHGLASFSGQEEEEVWDVSSIYMYPRSRVSWLSFQSKFNRSSSAYAHTTLPRDADV